MPTYEFRCPRGHEFEKFYRSIGAAPAEVTCPECGAIAERQLSAGAGLVFKGSGFYITDYGKDGKKDQSKPAVVAGESSSTPAGDKPSGSGDAAASAPAAPSDSGSKTSAEKKPAESKPAASEPTTAKSSSSKSRKRSE
jgi:putative FmdB family regulatory protein